MKREVVVCRTKLVIEVKHSGTRPQQKMGGWGRAEREPPVPFDATTESSGAGGSQKLDPSHPLI